jgi:GNAT superfamily N-acetyltransferase
VKPAPLEVTIRPARERDLAACEQVFLSSMRDLSRRKGFPAPRFRPGGLLPFFRHALRTDPKGFQVAVHRGRVVMFAITILRARWHFLAMFFGLPGKQSRGVGKRLLARAFDEPRPPKGHVRSVLASPDHRAQALYIRFGMLPRSMCYLIGGKLPKHVPASQLDLRQVGPHGRATRAGLALAGRFDLRFREARRDLDQRYLLSAGKGGRMFEALLAHETVGYVVVRANGAIGPGAVTRADLSGDLIFAAMGKAREMGLARIVAWIPGLNEGALRAAFGAGLHIEATTVWMAQKDVGDLRRYLPASGVLF